MKQLEKEVQKVRIIFLNGFRLINTQTCTSKRGNSSKQCQKVKCMIANSLSRCEVHISIRMDRHTLESGEEDLDLVQAKCNGKMVLVIKVLGTMVKQKGLGNSLISMVIFIWANGETTEQMVGAFSKNQQTSSITKLRFLYQANSRTMCNMASEFFKSLQKGQPMRVNLNKAIKMDGAFLNGQMDLHFKVTGSKEDLLDW